MLRIKTIAVPLALCLLAGAPVAHAAGSGRSNKTTTGQVRNARFNPPSKRAVVANLKIDTQKVSTRWKKLFLTYPDGPKGDLEIDFPFQIKVERATLPKGSAIEKRTDELIARYGDKGVFVYRDPKTKSLAVQRSPYGEVEFLLEVYDLSGNRHLMTADISDDGTGDWKRHE